MRQNESSIVSAKQILIWKRGNVGAAAENRNSIFAVRLELFDTGKVVPQLGGDGSTFLKASNIHGMHQAYLGKFSLKHNHCPCIWISAPPSIRAMTQCPTLTIECCEAI
jgi:hypothetical protein